MNVGSRILKTRFRKRLAAALLIGIVGFVWGWMLSEFTFGLGLRRASYDLPFLFRENPPPQDIVLIALDEASHVELDQPFSKAWNRSLHGKLVDKLAAAGARMIVFDILFHDENPEHDPPFAAAMRRHGNVVLAGEIVRNDPKSRVQESLLLATPELRHAAVGWGVTEFPIDSDGVVRRILHRVPTDFGEKPSLGEFVRKRLQGGDDSTGAEFELLNFYGRAETFPIFSYADVLSDRVVRKDVFHGKIVIVGLQQKSGLADGGKDAFPTPYLRMPVIEEIDGEKVKVQKLTSGMEIHATVIGNLMDGHRILSMSRQGGLVLMGSTALLLACLACLLHPLRGILLCFGLMSLVLLFAISAQRGHGFHFPWTIPVFGQMPLIASLALGGHYFIEYAGRWRLRRAFKSYMSEEQARLIDEDSVSLELGGKEVEATIFFSDLAGFTSMSEGLPPKVLSNALISYFERATEGILDNHGTIIKYIGDAVIATWGVPMKTDREADRAIDAAIQMQVAGLHPVLLESDDGRIEKVLETRVGIHTGVVLAGNLGSRRRFDYTVIGDVVNIAARLEGLNKMLGASVLVSESVLAKCEEPERFMKRKMGSFVLKGKKLGIVVFEILGYRDAPESAFRKRRQDYLEFYQQGLDSSLSGDLGKAIEGFSKSLVLHDRLPECPASRLHLDAIEAALSASLEWKGEIVLDSK